MRIDPCQTQKEETYQQFWYTVKKIKNTTSYEFDLADKKCKVDVEEDGVLSRLKFIRTGEEVQVYGRAIPDTMLTDEIKQSKAYQAFIPLALSLLRKPEVALELGKSMSLTEAEEEEAARRVHATHECLVTESNEPSDKPTKRLTGRRRPYGIAFRDTSTVSTKKPLDRTQKLKGIQVLDELTGKFTTSSEGVGIVPEVPDDGKGISATKVDAEIDWGSEDDSHQSDDEYVDEGEITWLSTDEEEKANKYNDEEDDDRSIDIAETDDEGTELENDDQEMTDAEKIIGEKLKEEKDDGEEEQADDDQAQEDQAEDGIVRTLVTMSQK
ncbi:hypothetical protein Tco_0512580 [Tanacetum coccineum]